MVKMYKTEMYIINLGDDLSQEEIKELIKQSLNGVAINCSVTFGEIKEKEIGEWFDDIKFNQTDTSIEEYRKEFEVK